MDVSREVPGGANQPNRNPQSAQPADQTRVHVEFCRDSANAELTGAMVMSGTRVRRRLQASEASVAHDLDCGVAADVNPSETLVVSGFARSGTTWLQQSLATMLRAKTVFEPFHHLAATAEPLHAALNISDKSIHVRELCFPYCGEPTLGEGPLYDAFAQSLQSVVPGFAVRILRTGVEESLRTRVVVKIVRGPLCLLSAQNTFSMPVVHISRDPRAVVASIRMTDWGWLYDHLSLREQLLEIDDGRADYFGKRRDEILEYDRQDTLTRVVAYWALTEEFLAQGYDNDGQRHRTWFLKFDQLCEQPDVALGPMFKALGVDASSGQVASALGQDSAMTSRSRVGISREERVAGWRKILTRDEITTIESIATHFGFADRLAN